MGSKIYHMGKWSYVDGNIRVNIDLTHLGEKLQEAQAWLGDRVLESCRACMPHATGDLQQRSKTEDGGRKVVFPGLYARYQYMGKVMVDKDTGKGPMRIATAPGEYMLRFKNGADLIATDRPLKYSDPNAVPKWFDVAKQRHGKEWVQGVKDIIGGKK